MGKAYISESMGAGRITSHGQITDLTSEFTLTPAQVPFSLYVRPKSDTDDLDIIASVKCLTDDGYSDAPLPLNDWSPLAVVALAPGAINLSLYDVYWGAGNYIGE